jgi:hypothetical protein
MRQYDLERLFEHPLKFRHCIPSAVVTFGGGLAGQALVQVLSRRSAQEELQSDELRLTWDAARLSQHFREIEEEIAIARTRDEDRATQVELAAVVVAVAVLSPLEPGVRFTRRSGAGAKHDYYLNDGREEMVEIAGHWEAGLPGLFEEKKAQSGLNQSLRKRWVSVTIFTETPRTRTEGLHS